MIYALLALVIILTLLTVVMCSVLVEVLRKLEWLQAVLIPWINALNTKLNLPK